MKKLKVTRTPYITDEEFNRIVAKRGIPDPWTDSKGDSAVDELYEVEIGENFPEEILDEDLVEETEEVETPGKKAS